MHFVVTAHSIRVFRAWVMHSVVIGKSTFQKSVLVELVSEYLVLSVVNVMKAFVIYHLVELLTSRFVHVAIS